MNQAISQFIEEFESKKRLQENKFPLKSLLILYMRGNKCDLYCDYFQGFKALVKWLSPIDIPQTNAKLFLPLYNYEQQEIARILNCDPAIIQQIFLEIYHGN